ncbi:uncharacterized protein LOC128884093 isoform X2 [Hylaeus volcanicus]|uniref:uncharacterized protein LOC128884093 isoform X2 n=1 Tax=Hylaeus volcanicus TaxID=313075 RepID=UPI0023B7EFFF|nr:uncharacterized protein LOC128884093 isoform X2 [Hylaeus volcanicus]
MDLGFGSKWLPQQPYMNINRQPQPTSLSAPPMNYVPQSYGLLEMKTGFPVHQNTEFRPSFPFNRQPISPLLPYKPYPFIDPKMPRNSSPLILNPSLPMTMSQNLPYNPRSFGPFTPQLTSSLPYAPRHNGSSPFVWPLNSFESIPDYRPSSMSQFEMLNSSVANLPTVPSFNNLNFPHYILSVHPSFKKKKFILQTQGKNQFKVDKNTFRKNNDNFILDSARETLFAIGPRRTYCKDIGYVQATGHPSSPAIVSVGESVQACSDYTAWMQKKIRSRCEIEGQNKIVNIIGRADVPTDDILIDVFDLYRFITYAFPHWFVIYDPELSPVLVIQRLKTKSCVSKQTQETVTVTEAEKSSSDKVIQDMDNFKKENTTDFNDVGDNQRETRESSLESFNISREVTTHSHNVLNIEKYILKTTQDKDFKINSPLGIIASWMYVEEKRRLHHKKTDPSISSAWLECIILVTPKTILIHNITKIEDLEFAWIQFFSLLRYFLIEIPQVKSFVVESSNSDSVHEAGQFRSFPPSPTPTWPYRMPPYNIFMNVPMDAQAFKTPFLHLNNRAPY